MDSHIHIVYLKTSNTTVSANQPDLLFMIKALHQIGQKIHLHCFYPQRVQLSLVESDCEEVIGYCQENREAPSIFFREQKMDVSEKKRLLRNLKNDEHPIICHGFQASQLVFEDTILKERKVLFRFLRNEPNYLQNLAKVTPWGLRKLYYLIAAFRAKRTFQKILTHRAIASSLENQINADNIIKVAEFKGQSETFFKNGMGSFCLYYADLSKRENEFAAQWLLEHVFNELELPFVIAGKNPSEELEQAAHVRMHTCLVSNPGEMELKELIKKAQIVLLPSFIDQQNYLDVLESLLLGRHVLVNGKAVAGNPFQSLLDVAESPDDFKQRAEQLFKIEFLEEQKNLRLKEIEKFDSDESNANKMISLLYRQYP